MNISRALVFSALRQTESTFTYSSEHSDGGVRNNVLAGLWVATFVVITIVCLKTGAAAQTTFGNIVGTVVDRGGATIPEASVAVTNENTGVVFTTSTAPDGHYLVDKLLPGSYVVAISKENFKRVMSRHLVLEEQQSLRVDVTLDVGMVSTEVEVVGGAPVVETESGELSFTRTSFELDALPVITPSGGLDSGTFPTNDPLNYVFSLPGAGVSRASSAGKFTIDGSLEGNTLIRVDGMNLRDNSNGVGYGGRPMIQATDELKIIGVDAPAEFDMPATVLISTRQGSNQVHGGLFYEGQQSVLDARNFFLPSDSAKPFSRKNDGGFYIGGPVKKNEVFLFGSWERERSDIGTTLVRNLPLPAFEAGDFSALINPAFVNRYLGGTPIVIRDPLNNGAPFPGNIIPTNRLNTVSKAIQSDFYNSTPGLPGISGNDVAGITVPRQAEKFDVRLDYARSSHHQIFAHSSYGNYTESNFSDGPLAADVRISRYPTREVSVSDSYSITPTMTNEFKGGFFRYVYGLEGQTESENKDWQTGWGLQQFGLSKNLPRIGISGFSAISSLPPIVFTSQSWELLDNLTFLKGKHAFKVGADVNRPRFAFRYDLYVSGAWNFGNQFTGYSYSDFLLGYPSSTDLTYPPPTTDTRSYEYSAFFQDTFEATHNLTLTYGVRWTNSRPPTAKDDVISNFDPITQSVVLASEQSRQFVSPQFPPNVPILTAAMAHFPSHSLRNGNPADFAPRFGFAYRVLGSTNTVIRGGYGLFFAPYDLDLSNSMGTFGVFRTDLSSTNLVQPGTTIPEFQFPRPYLAATQPGGGRVGYFGVDKNLHDAHYNQVHLAVEHGFGNTRLEASYIGNYGKQDIGYDLNQAPLCACVFSENKRPFAAFSGLSFFGPGNVYNYSALEVVGERRLHNGLTFLASYDWAKALAYSENDNGDVGNSPQNSHDFRAEYGNVSFTPRQTAKVSYSYELPFGKAKRFASANGVLNSIVGGWQLNGITTFRTGEFFSPDYSGYDSSGTGTFAARPDAIGNGNLPSSQRSINHWFNASAFVCPGQSQQICNPAVVTPIGRFGNARRNTLVGPHLSQWDFSIFKGFALRETMRLKFRIEAINLFNSPAFGFPATTISDPSTVGQITSTVNDPRIFQFGATLDF